MRDDAVARYILRRELLRAAFDGTEAHAEIDVAFEGDPNPNRRKAVKHAVTKQYRNTIPIDVAIEVVARRDRGEL
jgi:hypothetical protein